VLLVNTFGAKGSVATWHVEWAGHSDESELFAADGTSWRLNSRNSNKLQKVMWKYIYVQSRVHIK
jgi:hypothetical protein